MSCSAKSVNLSPYIISRGFVTVQTHCLDDVLHLLPDSEGQVCPSIVAHESKLQKVSVDPAVMRSGLWKNIQHQN